MIHLDPAMVILIAGDPTWTQLLAAVFITNVVLTAGLSTAAISAANTLGGWLAQRTISRDDVALVTGRR